jgi:hypothetical protein
MQSTVFKFVDVCIEFHEFMQHNIIIIRVSLTVVLMVGVCFNLPIRFMESHLITSTCA